MSLLLPTSRVTDDTHSALNDGVCARCASIPWDELAVPSALDDEFIFPVHETLKELQFSSCRICRLFADTVLTHTANSYPGPLNLRVCDTDIFDNSKIRGLFFDNRTSRSCEMASENPHYPHLVITSLGPRQTQAELQYLYPDRINMRQIRSWLNECDEHHDSSCEPASTAGLTGIRVIDCLNRSIEPAPLECQYVALSYVWGACDPTSVSCQSYDLKQALPRTIEDSVTVTLALGFRYLWVDRYCIDQTDSAEKHAQIHLMGDIYAAAQVTIVAAASADSETGLPGVRPFTRGVRFATGEYIAPLQLMVYPGLWTIVERSSHHTSQHPLNIPVPSNTDAHRTLQEFYLSRRRLVFTKRQVLFVCSSRTARETHPHRKVKGTDFRDMSPNEYFQYWMRWMPYPTLDDYTDLRKKRVSKAHTIMRTLEASSNREMSLPGDALHAITGILKVYAKDGVHHLWGAPCFASGNVYASHLCRGNSWIDPSRPERIVDLALLMDNFYPCERRIGFPSWSPLGWSTPFHWTGGEGPDRLRTFARHLTADASCITILSAGTSYKLSDIIIRTGSFVEDILSNASPHLKIAGRTTTVRLAGVRRDRRGPSIAFPLLDGNYAIFHPRWTAAPKDLDVGSTLKGLLLLGAEFMPPVVEHVYGMVLILRDHGDHYEKAGDFELGKELQPRHLWERWDEERMAWYSEDSSLTSRLDQLGVEDEYASKNGEQDEYDAYKETPRENSTGSQGERTSEYWWWKYFTMEEEIILG